MSGRFSTFRRRVIRPIVIIPLAVVVAGGVWLEMRSGKSAAATTTTVERTVDVTSGPLSQSVSASGTLAPADVENLNFAVSGQVTAVNVAAGQQVTKGTVLATIDSATLQNQVSQAQATVDTDQARLATDTANSASAAQLNADNANIAAAQASLAQAQAALAGATLTAPIDGTVSAVNLTVGEQLGNSGTGGTSLTGSGTGSGRTAASSSSGSGGGGSGGSGSSGSSTGQIQIVSTGAYVVNLSVDDTQIGLLKTGQQAVISRASAAIAGGGGRGGRFGAGGATTPTTTAGGANGGSGAGGANGSSGANGANGRGRTGAASAAVTGTVSSVGTIATSTSGVSSFPVVVAVSGNQSDFFNGATVQVSIVYNQIADAIQVPTAAVTTQNGQSMVTVVNGNSRVKTPVRTGLVSGGQTQILQGVTAGQQVVVTATVPAGTTATTNRNGNGGIFGNNGTGTRGTGTNGGTGGNGNRFGGGTGGGGTGFNRGAAGG